MLRLPRVLQVRLDHLVQNLLVQIFFSLGYIPQFEKQPHVLQHHYCHGSIRSFTGIFRILLFS
jgi:hypothetical protein